MKPLQRIATYRGFVGELKAVYTRTSQPTTKITRSRDMFDVAYEKFDEFMDDHEEFMVFHLNNSNEIVNIHEASKGGITGTMVDVRKVMQQALLINCTSMILVHNHPSGKLVPSMSDKQLTQKLKKAGEILDITVLDHLIVTRNSYFSFADESIL